MHPSSKSLVPSTVLVVDDEPRICAVLVRGLRAAGIRTYACANGTQASEIAASVELDAAVVDLEIGDECGISVAACLRVHQPLIRVVFHTGTCDMLALARAAAAGRVLRKPATIREIIAAVAP